MSRRRPTGRFFVLLLFIVGVIAFAIVNAINPGETQYALVGSGSSSNARRMKAVIMRSESVMTTENGSTVNFVAEEGSYVQAGDEIAYIYSAGYSTSQLEALESIRAQIRAYHLSILGTIIDTRLDALENDVENLALQVKSLVNGRTVGSILQLEDQLREAMEKRQSYLSQNQREDVKLTSLYENENKKSTQLSSWRSVECAPQAGVVSFYLDGYENFLSPDNTANITLESLRRVLDGRTMESGESRLNINIYRLVDISRWYAYVLADDPTFNPVPGQVFWFQMEGFEDVAYNATVVSTIKSGGTVVTLLEFTDPIGPLLNQRAGTAVVSTEMNGLLVPEKAIFTENGQTGVYVYNGTGVTFVPVIVLNADSDGVLVSTEYETALYVGSYVQLK